MASHAKHEHEHHHEHHEHRETAKEAKARHENEADEAAEAAEAAPVKSAPGHVPTFDELATEAKANVHCKECAERMFVGIANKFTEAIKASELAGATTTELAPITMLVDQLRFGATALASAIVMNTPAAKG